MKTLPFSSGRLVQARPAFALVTLLVLASCSTPSTDSRDTKTMKLQSTVFGNMPDGAPVRIYTLANRHGMTAKITEYGAILTELWVPDRHGKSGNVVLGFDNLGAYYRGHPYFGAIAGRVANRIAKGKFTLEGKE